MTRRLPAFPRPDAAPWRSRASIAPDRPVVVLAASTGARFRKAASRPLDMLACLLVSFLLVASAGLGFSACAEPGGVMVFLATGCTTLVILHGLSAFGRLRPLVYAVAFLSSPPRWPPRRWRRRFAGARSLRKPGHHAFR